MTPVSNDRLKDLISSFQSKRVAVVGDLILDVYLWGDASRISQEAPVPVMRVNKRTERLGGAANVMCNIVTLGSKAFAYGVTGEDGNGAKLKQLLGEFAIADAGVFKDKMRITTEKQRVIAGSQQLVRIDHEDLHDVDESLRRNIVDSVVKAINNQEIDAVIFINGVDGRTGLRVAQEDGLFLAQAPVKFVRDFFGAFGGTHPAGNTLFFIHVPGLFVNPNLEPSWGTGDIQDLGIGHDLDIGMFGYLNQLG